jgi:lysine decarboxylase/arginine decarboxylase
MSSCVTAHEVVIVDRNCHKSVQHALTLTGAIPIYLVPTRNAYGIIGGIPFEQLNAKNIQKLIDQSPLITNKSIKPQLAIITNSTYDGLLYDVVAVKEKLAGSVEQILFDEAWFAYARFHELYNDRYGMCETHEKHHPTIFATQSTHKLLAAFSQASMIHVKSGAKPVDHHYFNESFMMYTSTSPQYNMIASLDVASRMMEAPAGRELLHEAIREAIVFRKKIVQMRKQIFASDVPTQQKWFFDVWQPQSEKNGLCSKIPFEQVEAHSLETDASHSKLNPRESWHGYPKLSEGQMMLDPVKVTLLMPGINPDGTMSDTGIPAPILSNFLISRDIVDEKTGFYTFLLLFSIGVINAKTGTLLAALLEFKQLYDANVLVHAMFPKLAKDFPAMYGKLSIQALAQTMHTYLKQADIGRLTINSFSQLPEPIMTPQEAHQALVKGKVEVVRLDDLNHRVAAVMLVPYPPGIPIMMPGEKFNERAQAIIRYLKVYEGFDQQFPGFETEIHGIIKREEGGKVHYAVPCIRK